MKIGLVLLVLGVLHFFNVFFLNRYRRGRLRQQQTQPPLPPAGRLPMHPQQPPAAAAAARHGRSHPAVAGPDRRTDASAGAGVTELADPAGHGAGRIGYFTVLYDEGCPICRAAHRWLAGRAQLVPLVFVPAGSAEARQRFPGLDHAATLRDLTVIADTGAVYVHDGAWLACLWALADYRGDGRAARIAAAAARGPPVHRRGRRRPAGRPGRRTTVTSVTTAAGDAPPPEEKPRRARGEQTRQLILETALRLFRERGYAETTMRAIAKEAGVAVGNAYYYFDSKEHLIQGFYDRNQQAHRAAAEAVLRSRAGLRRPAARRAARGDRREPSRTTRSRPPSSRPRPSRRRRSARSPASPRRPGRRPSRSSATWWRGPRSSSTRSCARNCPSCSGWAGWAWCCSGSTTGPPDQRRTRRLIDGVVPLIDRLVGAVPAARPAARAAPDPGPDRDHPPRRLTTLRLLVGRHISSVADQCDIDRSLAGSRSASLLH